MAGSLQARSARRRSCPGSCFAPYSATHCPKLLQNRADRLSAGSETDQEEAEGAPTALSLVRCRTKAFGDARPSPLDVEMAPYDSSRHTALGAGHAGDVAAERPLESTASASSSSLDRPFPSFIGLRIPSGSIVHSPSKPYQTTRLLYGPWQTDPAARYRRPTSD